MRHGCGASVGRSRKDPMESGAVGSTAPRRGHHRPAERPARPAFRRCLTEVRPVARGRGAFNERLKRRGETRTRHQAGLPVLRNQVLRPEPQPDRLPELRHGFRRRRGAAASRRRAQAGACAEAGAGRPWPRSSATPMSCRSRRSRKSRKPMSARMSTSRTTRRRSFPRRGDRGRGGSRGAGSLPGGGRGRRRCRRPARRRRGAGGRALAPGRRRRAGLAFQPTAA